MKKRNEILSILVLSIFLLQNIALASAIYIPPDDDPPPPTYYNYTWSGVVKESGTNLPIANAKVMIYKGTTTYLGYDLTDSLGRYIFSKRTTLMTQTKTIASADGHVTNTKISPVVDNIITVNHWLNKATTTYSITGQFVASDTNEGIAGMSVDIFRYYNNWFSSDQIGTAVTDTNGVFTTQYSTLDTLDGFGAQGSTVVGYLQPDLRTTYATAPDFGTINVELDPILPDNILAYRDSCDCLSRWDVVREGEIWDRGKYEFETGTLKTEDGYLYASIPSIDIMDYKGPRFYQKILNPVAIKDIAELSLDIEMINPGTSYMGKIYVDFYDENANLAFRVQVGDYSNGAYDTWIGGYYYDSSGSHQSFPDLHLDQWRGTLFYRYRDGLGLNFYGPQIDGSSKEVRLIDEVDMGTDNERMISHIVISFDRYYYQFLTQLNLYSIDIHKYGTTDSSEIWHIDGSTLTSEFQFDPTWPDETEMLVSNRPDLWTIRSIDHMSDHVYDLYVYDDDQPEFNYDTWAGPCNVHTFGEAIFLDQLIDLSIDVEVEHTTPDPPNVYRGLALLTFYDQFLNPVFRVKWGDTGYDAYIWAYYYTETGTKSMMYGSELTFQTSKRIQVSFSFIDNIGIVGTYEDQDPIVLCDADWISSNRKLQFAAIQMGWDGNQKCHTDLHLYDISLSVSSNPVVDYSANAILQEETIFEWRKIDSIEMVEGGVSFHLPERHVDDPNYDNRVLGAIRLIIEGYSEESNPSIAFRPEFIDGGHETSTLPIITVNQASFEEVILIDPTWVSWWGTEGNNPNMFRIIPVTQPEGTWYLKASIKYAYVGTKHIRYATQNLLEKVSLGCNIGDEHEVDFILPNHFDSLRSCFLSFDVDTNEEEHMIVYLNNEIILERDLEVLPIGIDHSIFIDISKYVNGKSDFNLRFYFPTLGDVYDGLRLLNAELNYQARLCVAPDTDSYWTDTLHMVYSRSGTCTPVSSMIQINSLFSITAMVRERPDDDPCITFGLNVVNDYANCVPISMNIEIRAHGSTNGVTTEMAHVYGLDGTGSALPIVDIASDLLSALGTCFGALKAVDAAVKFGIFLKLCSIPIGYIENPFGTTISGQGFYTNEYRDTTGVVMQLSLNPESLADNDLEIIITTQIGDNTFTDSIWYYNPPVT